MSCGHAQPLLPRCSGPADHFPDVRPFPPSSLICLMGLQAVSKLSLECTMFDIVWSIGVYVPVLCSRTGVLSVQERATRGHRRHLLQKNKKQMLFPCRHMCRALWYLLYLCVYLQTLHRAAPFYPDDNLALSKHPPPDPLLVHDGTGALLDPLPGFVHLSPHMSIACIPIDNCSLGSRCGPTKNSDILSRWEIPDGSLEPFTDGVGDPALFRPCAGEEGPGEPAEMTTGSCYSCEYM